MANWMDMMVNPKIHHVKKTMFEVLKERYAQNENIIERIGVAMATEGDLKAFFSLVTDIYELAYMKAVADHHEQLSKLGLAVNIVADKKSRVE
jgi:hypothetical protein